VLFLHRCCLIYCAAICVKYVNFLYYTFFICKEFICEISSKYMVAVAFLDIIPIAISVLILLYCNFSVVWMLYNLLSRSDGYLDDYFNAMDQQQQTTDVSAAIPANVAYRIMDTIRRLDVKSRSTVYRMLTIAFFYSVITVVMVFIYTTSYAETIAPTCVTLSIGVINVFAWILTDEEALQAWKVFIWSLITTECCRTLCRSQKKPLAAQHGVHSVNNVGGLQL
jgi:hypothetical protein